MARWARSSRRPARSRPRGGQVPTYVTNYTFDTWNRTAHMVYPDQPTSMPPNSWAVIGTCRGRGKSCSTY
jgi:hypothetical protein